MPHKHVFLLSALVDVGKLEPLRVGLALLLLRALLFLSALVNVGKLEPLRIGLALLFFSALVNVSELCGKCKYLKSRKPETLRGKLTEPLGISLAVLDFFGLNRGCTGKAGSEANNGRHSGDTHVEH
jgi:hypothetical protein